MEKDKTLLGAHVSIAGGFDQAIYRGAAIGCNTIQIFTQSNRRWGLNSVKIQADSLDKYYNAQHETGIKDVVAHASYLINLASTNNETATKSEQALLIELDRCEQLNIKHLVLHPGSNATSKSLGTQQLGEKLSRILDKTTSKTKVLLELMAGQGNCLGSSFEQLKELLDLTNRPEQTGICFDTCHAWAAGYNFNDLESYMKMFNDFDKVIGLKNLAVIHLNDAKSNFNSHLDRHADIGKGQISLDAFTLLMNDPRFINIPKILETPKEDLEDDLKNLTILKELIR